MSTLQVVTFLTSLAFTGRVSAVEQGLVAHYNFDEGDGSTLHDVSGQGNDGIIHGARYVRRGRGFCLEFDGVDNYVDCGRNASLDLREVLTLEAWVFPTRRVKGEPGILGKHFNSYLLSYYADGQCWWYVSGGGNNAKSLLTPGSWHHVVSTFDGKLLRLYLDAKLANANPSKFQTVKSGGNFFIGCVLGDADATDPNYGRSAFFPGQIDELKVYNRALSETEVKSHFDAGVKDLSLTAAFQPVKRGAAVRRREMSVRAGGNGQVQISAGREAYLVESGFSFPGERTGWNRFSATEPGGETGWAPRVRKISDTAIAIEAQGEFYRLRRLLKLASGKVFVEDTLTNLRSEPIGFIIRTTLTAPAPFRNAFTPGGAENPTLYVAGASSCLGVVAEDNLTRLHFEPSLGLPSNQARFQIRDIALDAGKSYTLRWTIYPLMKGASYLDLVNQLRRDWHGNFRIEGPFSFFDIGEKKELLNNPEQLKAYLHRKHLGVVGLSPWLDYDPGTFDRVWTRAEYKERMQQAMRALKTVNPTIKCVGCIETDWVTIYPERIPNGDKLPSHGRGSGLLNAEQTRIIDEANLPWKDSVKRKVDGNVELELYSRGGKRQTALSVYPAVGNYQHEFLMGQVKFLLEDVGLDGFYIDEFNQAWRGGIPTYSGWDGWSVEMDPSTGRIARKYVDCSLAGVASRVALERYALERGKVVIANTYATAQEERSLPVNRFSETQASFDPFAVPDGTKPPEVPFLYRGALASPIGLGILGVSGQEDTARRVMKAVVTYLRHGVLYYHYAIQDIPETGPGSGGYGPINHMFPITPVELHEGSIIGKERIVTCVSGKFDWPIESRPVVRLFGLDGREINHAFAITRYGKGWRVDVKLKDWAEVAVVEHQE